jgi:Trk-type K+ transport system membrane component
MLIVTGAGSIMISEYVLWNGPENGGGIITAFFHSVTARTAGFNTVSMSHIGPLTVQILMVLMLIGGSPGGTAGGMRTTVFAVGIAHIWSQIRMSRRGMVVFNRTIPPELGTEALALAVLTAIWLSVSFAALLILQTGSGVSETKLLFELISAFATVGLSLDLTPSLTDGAKMLLILNMFVGRVGLMTAITTFVSPDRRPPSGKPRETILLS